MIPLSQASGRHPQCGQGEGGTADPDGGAPLRVPGEPHAWH